MTAVADVAAVVIGRNEGARLERCLASLEGEVAAVFYVDSGSTDGSVEAARRSGARVVRLDPGSPFTAARARNEGLAAIVEADPEGRFAFVQFIDGDCELEPGWVAAAAARLRADPEAAVACGRRREKFPEASVYNRLCDMEWDTAIGRAAACGGDSLMRRSALTQVGDFDPSLIAGEEPELCFRLRRAGWTVWRLDAPMTRHDAAITRFGQWWRRAVRGGWAYAEGFDRHGASAERYNWRAVRSIAAWGIVGPLVVVAATMSATWRPETTALLVASVLGYGAMTLRIAVNRRRRCGASLQDALIYGVFTMLAKLPQAIGMVRYLRHRLRDAPATIIEYKS